MSSSSRQKLKHKKQKNPGSLVFSYLALNRKKRNKEIQKRNRSSTQQPKRRGDGKRGIKESTLSLIMYSSSFSTKKVLNLSSSLSSKLRKSVSSLDMSAAVGAESDLWRFPGRSSAAAGGSNCLSFFLSSL